jgi:hypothetical protein
MPKLRTYVHVARRDADGKPTGMTEMFGPDDRVPEWAVAEITNPKAWAEPPSEPAKTTSSGQRSEGQDTPGAKVPPRGGAGSGRDAWAAYATAHGVEVTEDMASRDDIIAALDKAGVPTE